MGKYSDGSGVDPRRSLTTAPCISQAIVEANVHSGNVFYRGELNRVYPIMERGEGVYIYDSEGNKYLDAMSGIAVVNLGYGTPEVVDAMAEQAKKLPFCFTVRFTTQVQEDLA